MIDGSSHRVGDAITQAVIFRLRETDSSRMIVKEHRRVNGLTSGRAGVRAQGEFGALTNTRGRDTLSTSQAIASGGSAVIFNGAAR